MVRHPRKWSDKETKAALDLIEREFPSAKIWEEITDDRVELRWLGPRQMARDLAAKLKSGEEISLSPSQDRVLIGLLIEDLLDATSSERKGPGPRPKPGELRHALRRSVSIMPEAELFCESLVGFLKSRGLKRVEHIRDLAIEWTVARLNKSFEEITKTSLGNYMNRFEKHPRRFSPKPHSG
jgi:hypothetical protein